MKIIGSTQPKFGHRGKGGRGRGAGFVGHVGQASTRRRRPGIIAAGDGVPSGRSGRRYNPAPRGYNTGFGGATLIEATDAPIDVRHEATDTDMATTTKAKTAPTAKKAAPAPAAGKASKAGKVATAPASAVGSAGAKAWAGLTEAQILAQPESEYMSKAQLAFFREKLVELRANILTNATDTGEHLRDTEVATDPSDRATQEEEYTLELRTRDRERKLLKKVDKSLRMVDDGSFGWCEETGEPIGVARLIARPTATLSIEAQERRERMQKLYGD